MNTSGGWRFEESLDRARAHAGGEALGELLQRYKEYLCLLARLRLGTRLGRKVDPVDVVQDAFVTVTARFREFSGRTEAEWTRWLRLILNDRIVDVIRRYCGSKKRDLGLEQDIAALDRSSQAIDGAFLAQQTSPTQQAVRREWAVLVANALARLPEGQREVLVGRYLEGLSNKDIAVRLGRTVDSVQNLLARGLAKLRLLLEAEG